MAVSSLRLASAIVWITTALFLLAVLFVALVIPIHAQDALTFGEWSRLVSQHWHLRYAAATGQEYGRPLFYVLQGWVWGIFGYAEPLGRVLSGLFSVLLLGSVVWLVRDRDWGSLAGLLAAFALISSPVFAAQAVSGLTDIPVAALVALAGALVWGRRPAPARAVAIGVVAALAMLAKPSALLALIGLALAQLLLGESWRSRLLYRVAPLGAGIGLGLLYDFVQARYVHQGLRTFLQAGVNSDYYRTLADEARRYALLDGNWFGDGLRSDRWQFDGWQATIDQLAAAGVPTDQIHIAGLCTAAYSNLFCSYRRGRRGAGRMAAAIRCCGNSCDSRCSTGQRSCCNRRTARQRDFLWPHPSVR